MEITIERSRKNFAIRLHLEVGKKKSSFEFELERKGRKSSYPESEDFANSDVPYGL